MQISQPIDSVRVLIFIGQIDFHDFIMRPFKDIRDCFP